MEAVAAGASVLTFIAFALKSTEAVYQTISGIRDAPQHVQDLSSSIKDLTLVLEQLQKTKAIAEDGNGRDLRAVRQAVKRCEEDVARFERELKNLQPVPGEGRSGVAWKRVKTRFRKDEIQSNQMRIIHHTGHLGMHLNMFSCDVDIAHHRDSLDKVNQILQNQKIQASTTTGLLVQQTSTLTLVQDTVGACRDAQASYHIQQAQMLQQHGHSLAAIQTRADELSGMSKHEAESLRAMLAQLQGQAADVLSRMPRMSAEAGSSMRDMALLETVQSVQLQGKDNFSNGLEKSDSSTRTEGGQSSKGEPLTCEHDYEESEAELFASITRLSSLAQEKSNSVASGGAQPILDDLERLLQAVSRQLETLQSCDARGVKRKRANDATVLDRIPQGDQDERDLKKIRGLLVSSDDVVLNEPVPRQHCPISSGQIRRKRSTRVINMRSGKITVQTWRKWLRGTKDHSADREERNPQEAVEFSAVVGFMPNDSRITAKLSAFFHQKKVAEGAFTLKPTLWIQMIVPADSEIFALVKKGNLKGMIDLIREGKASIRDCDPRRRSLLAYACYARRPNVCKFLLENGADPNSLEQAVGLAYGKNPTLYSPLAQTPFQSDEYRVETSRSLNCRRLLLEAGADPSLRGDSHSSLTALEDALQVGSTESLRLLLDFNGQHANMEETFENGQTLLLYNLRYSTEPSLEVLSLLLSRNQDVHARDDSGNTSLHLFFQRTHPPYTSGGRDCLVKLVRSGADISAKNKLGVTVSDVAYDAPRRPSWMGSYLFDLWTAVLLQCGYDPDFFRGGHSKETRFSSHYTPFHYQALMKGHSWDWDDHGKWCNLYGEKTDIKDDRSFMTSAEEQEAVSVSESGKLDSGEEEGSQKGGDEREERKDGKSGRLTRECIAFREDENKEDQMSGGEYDDPVWPTKSTQQAQTGIHGMTAEQDAAEQPEELKPRDVDWDLWMDEVEPAASSTQPDPATQSNVWQTVHGQLQENNPWLHSEPPLGFVIEDIDMDDAQTWSQ